MFTIGIDYGTNSVRALVVRCADGAEFGSASSTIHRRRRRPARSDRPSSRPPATRRLSLRAGAQRRGRAGRGDEEAGLRRRRRRRDRRRYDRIEPAAGRRAKIVRSPSTPNGMKTSPRNAGCGRTTPAGARRPRSPNSPPSIAGRNTSPNAAASIPRNGSGRKSGTASNVAPEVFDAAFSWVEIADWIPSVLAGVADPRKIKRGVCAAGHKALYSDEWGGLPDKEFLALLDPKLAALRDRLYDKAYDAREAAGTLCAAWAKRLGLPAGIPIAIGEFDVHYGAIGCGIREGTLVKVIGTSTCDLRRVGREERRRHSRHLRHRQGRGPARLLRHRGRPVGGRRYFQMVGRVGVPGRRRRCTPSSAPRRPSRSRGRRACSRSTGTTATAPSSSISC